MKAALLVPLAVCAALAGCAGAPYTGYSYGSGYADPYAYYGPYYDYPSVALGGVFLGGEGDGHFHRGAERADTSRLGAGPAHMRHMGGGHRHADRDRH